jgi:hypothetical protein
VLQHRDSNGYDEPERDVPEPGAARFRLANFGDRLRERVTPFSAMPSSRSKMVSPRVSTDGTCAAKRATARFAAC